MCARLGHSCATGLRTGVCGRLGLRRVLLVWFGAMTLEVRLRRMALLASICGALVLLGAVSSASSEDVARAADPVVILLSWDGVRHDYPERADLPGLRRMQREGARADQLVPVYPSDTFPNHVSLATGTHPDRHGIMGNTFRDAEREPGFFSYDKDASWIEAEPLWCAAERQGVIAATYFWVGSETDWRGIGATYRKTPFDSSIGEDAKVEQILEWLDLPVRERPRLIMSWWHGADRPGHSKGPDHPSVVSALVEQDAQLVRLLEALDSRNAWPHTTLIVVSDHGMTRVTHPVPFGSALEQAGVRAQITRGSAIAHVFLEDPTQLEQAEQLLQGFAELRVYRRQDVPESLRIRHPTRNGDLVLVTDPPNTLVEPSSAREFLARVGSLVGWHTGMHGYDPEHPDMGAVFFAMGRGVAPGSVPARARTIDVAATVAKLLGIDPPSSSEGSVIPGIAVGLP